MVVYTRHAEEADDLVGALKGYVFLFFSSMLSTNTHDVDTPDR
jgi:hypothetical protein